MKNIGVNNAEVMKISSRSSKKSKIIRKKKRFSLFNKLPGIIRFLTSDSYFYSHFIASSCSTTNYSTLCNVHQSDLRRNEPILGTSEGKLKEKLVKYLKADVYLYAPLEDVRHRDDVLVKNVVSSPREQELQFRRVTRTDLSKKIACLQQLAQDSIVEQRGVRKSKGGHPGVGVISPRTPAIPNGNIRRKQLPLI